MISPMLVPRLRANTRRLGWPGGVALALLAIASAVVFVAVPQRERELKALRADVEEARERALRAARAAKAGSAPVDPGESFTRAFPPAGSRHDRVAALLALASKHGLAGSRSEYRFQPEPALGMARYRVVLPLSGPYPALRAFVAEALVGDPALALDSVRIRRSDAQAPHLQADFQFSLLMRLDAQAPGQPAVLAELPR